MDLHDWAVIRNEAFDEVEKITDPCERLQALDGMLEGLNQLIDPNWIVSYRRAAQMRLKVYQEIRERRNEERLWIG